jgi:hypothetical protein
MPVMVNAPVFVNWTSPLVVLLALKLDVAFAPFNVSPPTELTVKRLPLIKPDEPSETAPVEVKVTLFVLPALTLPVMLIAPVLLIATLPVPVSLIPLTTNEAAVFTREIPPLASVALKLVTVLALPKLVPNAETVVRAAPLIKLLLISLIAPLVAVRETLPLVLRLPPFRLTLRPAAIEMRPDVLSTLALTRMSLPAPVALKLTLPVPSAMTVLPSVSVPVEVREIEPLEPVLIAPLLPKVPVLPITILPPPAWLIPVIINAPVLVN